MTPRDLYERMRRHWLADEAAFDPDMLTEDVVVETPFAMPGSPTITAGREEVLAYTRAGHASVPFRFHDCRTIAVHETTDPQTIVVEYELHATMTATGEQASAPFIALLTARDGRIARWREYQNPVALAAAMSGGSISAS